MRVLLLVLSGLFWASGCSEGSGRKSHGGAVEQPAEQKNSDATAVAMSLDQCNSAGKAWRPVVNGGASPSDCNGGTLKPWNNNCCKGMVVARFQSLASKAPDLVTTMTSHLDNNFTMHACSDRPDGKPGAVIHFYKVDGTKTYYEFIDISAREQEVTYDCGPENSILGTSNGLGDFGDGGSGDESSNDNGATDGGTTDNGSTDNGSTDNGSTDSGADGGTEETK